MQDVKEWEKVKSIEVFYDFDFNNYIPTKDTYQEAIIIGRQNEIPIKKSMWKDILDKNRPDEYSKLMFVKSYFTVCFYTLNRLKSITVCANQSCEEIVDLRFTSSKRNSTTNSLRIENVLNTGYTKETGGSIQNTLTIAYELTSISEYSEEKSKSTTKTVRFEAIEKDRNVVFWEFSKLIALYRMNKDNSAKLLAYNDYHLDTKATTYMKE